MGREITGRDIRENKLDYLMVNNEEGGVQKVTNNGKFRQVQKSTRSRRPSK